MDCVVGEAEIMNNSDSVTGIYSCVNICFLFCRFTTCK